jgi:hypothetical protein
MGKIRNPSQKSEEGRLEAARRQKHENRLRPMRQFVGLGGEGV